MYCPCKDCGVRKHGCHGNCAQYKKWRDWLSDCKEKERNARTMYILMGGPHKK